jgi:hypothetical protein
MKKQKKQVEWKETNNFIFTPKYEYSLPIRNRYVFFWCLGKNYRKMLNYAENFTAPNNICCVYIYGDIGKKETFEKFLGQKCGNILVLHLPDVDQEIEIADRFSKWLSDLKAQGMRKIVDEGKKKSQYSMVTIGRTYADEPSDIWLEQFEKVKRAVANGDTDCVKWLERLQSEYDLWAIEYPAAMASIKAKLGTGYTAYGVSGDVAGSEADHNDSLLQIAKSTYPCGIEADTDKDLCYKIAAIKRMAQGGIKGEGAEGLGIKLSEQANYQFNFFEDVTRGASEAIRAISDWCEYQIKNKGCFHIRDVWALFARPPFGAYPCNWYMWIIAYALRQYADEKYFFAVLLSSIRMLPESFYHALTEVYTEPRRRMVGTGGTVFIQNEEQDEFRRLLMRMFDIEKPWQETTHSVLSQVRAWITDKIHYVPLDALDHKWLEVLRFREDSYWFSFGYEKEYLPWLKENFDRFYTEIRQLDAKLHERLVKEYGQVRADLYYKFSYVKGGAIGWLHSAEMMEEGIKKYMARENVCRECGRPLVYEEFKHHGYTTYVYDENHHSTELRFLEKDIIGLNKKLLGRYQNEYFCIPCLCDVLDCEAIRLHEMLEEFREAGCELFS